MPFLGNTRRPNVHSLRLACPRSFYAFRVPKSAIFSVEKETIAHREGSILIEHPKREKRHCRRIHEDAMIFPRCLLQEVSQRPLVHRWPMVGRPARRSVVYGQIPNASAPLMQTEHAGSLVEQSCVTAAPCDSIRAILAQRLRRTNHIFDKAPVGQSVVVEQR